MTFLNNNMIDNISFCFNFKMLILFCVMFLYLGIRGTSLRFWARKIKKKKKINGCANLWSGVELYLKFQKSFFFFFNTKINFESFYQIKVKIKTSKLSKVLRKEQHIECFTFPPIWSNINTIGGSFFYYLKNCINWFI